MSQVSLKVSVIYRSLRRRLIPSQQRSPPLAIVPYIHTILKEQVEHCDTSLLLAAADSCIGGGHAPDIITVCGHDNVLPSSTNPTRPFTRNTVDEHLDVRFLVYRKRLPP
jgi:hypothetical protein